MFNLQDFIAHIGKVGVARDNRFDFWLDKFPDALLPNLEKVGLRSNDTNRQLSLMVKSVSLPGTNVATIERNDNSLTRKVPYDRSFGDLDVVFLCSADMKEKKFFDEWKNLIFKSNKVVEYYDSIITNATIECHTTQYSDISYRVRVLELYPVTVTPLSLDKTTENQTLTFQVTFAFRDIKEDSPEYDDYATGKNLSNVRDEEDQRLIDEVVAYHTNMTADTIDASIINAYKPAKDSGISAVDYDSSVISGYQQTAINNQNKNSTPAAIIALRNANAALNINRILEQIKTAKNPKQIIVLMKEVQANIERAGGSIDSKDMTNIMDQINNILFVVGRIKQ